MPQGKNKTVIGLKTDELAGKSRTKTFELKAKTYSCLIDDGIEDKKAKRTKGCFIKRNLEKEIILKFQNYNDCLELT